MQQKGKFTRWNTRVYVHIYDEAIVQYSYKVSAQGKSKFGHMNYKTKDMILSDFLYPNQNSAISEFNFHYKILQIFLDHETYIRRLKMCLEQTAVNQRFPWKHAYLQPSPDGKLLAMNLLCFDTDAGLVRRQEFDRLVPGGLFLGPAM